MKLVKTLLLLGSFSRVNWEAGFWLVFSLAHIKLFSILTLDCLLITFIDKCSRANASWGGRCRVRARPSLPVGRDSGKQPSSARLELPGRARLQSASQPGWGPYTWVQGVRTGYFYPAPVGCDATLERGAVSFSREVARG